MSRSAPGTEPGLSVIMPTYNGEPYIDLALGSIATQTQPPLEVIVVDDGSTDATLDVVKSYEARLPVRLLRPERRGNWLAMTNIGIAEAKGMWCTILHQDDVWASRRNDRLFAELARFRDTPGLVVMRTRFIDDAGRDIGPWPFPRSLRRKRQPVDISWSLYIQNWIAVPSAVFSTTKARDRGGMDEALWYTADWDLWLKLARDDDVVLLDELGSLFRVHNGSQTVSGSRDLDKFRNQLVTVQERHQWAIEGHAESEQVRRAGCLATETNIFLAGTLHGAGHSLVPWLHVARSAGLNSAVTYLNHSAIASRLLARLRARAIHRVA